MTPEGAAEHLSSRHTPFAVRFEEYRVQRILVEPKKGSTAICPQRPGGCFAQVVLVPFFVLSVNTATALEQRCGQFAAVVACQFGIARQQLKHVDHQLARGFAELLFVFLDEFQSDSEGLLVLSVGG